MRACRTPSGPGEQSAVVGTWRGAHCGFKGIDWGWMVELRRQGVALEGLEEFIVAHGRRPGDKHWSM